MLIFLDNISYGSWVDTDFNTISQPDLIPRQVMFMAPSIK